MKDKIYKILDEPLFGFFSLIGVYILWTFYNGHSYNKELLDCYNQATNEYQKSECTLMYYEQDKDPNVGQ